MNIEKTQEFIRIRYGETDQMGHAYYANYLYWMEQARGAWCREHGFNYSDLESMGYFLPVVEVHLRYKGEIKYDEIIRVDVWVSEVGRAAIRFDYEILNESGRLCTDGYSWHVLMNESRKATSIPVEVRAMMESPRVLRPADAV